MSRISKYIISLTFLLMLAVAWCPGAQAQYPSDEKYGLRIGTDLSRILVHYLNPYRTDMTIHADVRVDTNWYAVAEAGWNKTHLENNPVLEYKSNGYFLRIGADYNVLKPSFPHESNMIYLGLRYGAALMTREVPEYEIAHPFWGDVQGQLPSKTLFPQWVEAVIGMKVEVLNNLFLSWGLHLRLLLTGNVDETIKPYVIPGFGKATSNAVFDANYSISYRIPLWKAKPLKHPAEKEHSSKEK